MYDCENNHDIAMSSWLAVSIQCLPGPSCLAPSSGNLRCSWVMGNYFLLSPPDVLPELKGLSH